MPQPSTAAGAGPVPGAPPPATAAEEVRLPRYEWTVVAADAAAVDTLAQAHNLPLPVAHVLAARGFADPAAAARFLDPRLQHLGDPLAFPGMLAAADRIWRAIRAQEELVVFGDFDADGVTATMILTGAIRRLGGRVAAFLPERSREGYGLTQAGLDRCLAEHPAQVLITVDCGISGVAEVASARAAGVDVIVTDHHATPGALPVDCVLVNPHLGATAGAEHLCGAGVAFKLVHALVKRGREAGWLTDDAVDPREWLDAVAVATVADVVPLVGENRTLVAAGLRRLQARPSLGLKALMSRAGLAGTIRSHHLAFVLGPRLNAAGRMRTAWPAYELLASESWDPAVARAIELEHLNAERRQVESQVLRQAEDQVAAHFAPARDGAVVVGAEGWHPGILGIVAARLSERFNRPAAVVALDAAGGGRGSLRAGHGYDAVQALTRCHALLLRYGGHQRAGGFTLQPGAFTTFRTSLAAVSQAQVGDVRRQPPLAIDAWLTADQLDPALWNALQRLEPFGEGHPVPRWGLRRVRLAAPASPIGAGGEHLRLAFLCGTRRLPAVWFRMGSLAPRLRGGAETYDVVGELNENTFGGQTELQLQVVDLRPTT